METGRFGGLLVAVAVLGTAATVAWGCGGKKTACKQLYQRATLCKIKFRHPKRTFLAICKKDVNANRERAALRCIQLSDCDKFETCLTRMSQNGDLGRDIVPQSSPQRRAQAFHKLAAQAQKKLDSGSLENHRKLCADLDDAAQHMADVQKAKTRVLCERMRIGRMAQLAIKHSRIYAQKKIDDLPMTCKSSLKLLHKAKGDYAVKLKAKVVRACYVTAGVVVLKKKLPRMRRYCGPVVRQLLAAVRKYKVTDPTLDPLVARAAKICKK